MTHTAKHLSPDYGHIHNWELYSEQLLTELRQCREEGLDMARYEALFRAVAAMDRGEDKKRMADVLFDILRAAPTRADYPYDEPSDLPTILEKANPAGQVLPPVDHSRLREKIQGAWYGRISGCMLGKTVEGIRTGELHPLLKDSGNFPMHRYILSSDITDEVLHAYTYPLAERCYADRLSSAPADDDTNYTVLYQLVVERYGRDFTPADVAQSWLALQPKDAYCTAERVAFCNFVKGYAPPDSAQYQNPYREWIGAQIRGDYFGYINPGDPTAAADMAWRDASISHVKNGIYGEMYIAAMLAAAAASSDLRQIIQVGLDHIPAKSRLHEAVRNILSGFDAGVSQDDCFAGIHSRWDECNEHDWCHTISNAEIVTACLLYGGEDFSRSICMAVQAGFDTDCNGATVGSILGMKNGIGSIDPYWTAPFRGRLDTQIFGVGTVSIDSVVETTMKHIAQK